MQVVSYGGGTNSKAMVCEMVRRAEPIDLITMADPGSEWPHTYADAWQFSAWLEMQGYPSLTIVRNDGMYGTLEANCLAQHMLPSIAYGYKSCSDKYKVRPQNNFVAADSRAQALWTAGGKVIRCIGYHADESERAGITEDRRYRYRYPLIEWRMGQAECLAAIARVGLPQPGKSACTFCPSSRPHEIFRLQREHPDLLARALAIEANAVTTNVKGLGRHWSWRDLLDADARQGKLFAIETALPCGCYDGDSEDDA
jgi:hypothetical protein